MQCPYVQIYEKKTGLFEKRKFCRCTSKLNPSVKNGGDGEGYVAWKRCVDGKEHPVGVDFTKCMYYSKYN